MSATQSDQQGQRSAGLTLSFSSNNPFRNRAASPTNLPQSPASPFDDPPPPPRPVSRNPFLDPNNNPIQKPLISPESMASKSDRVASPSAEELFDNLILDDRKDLRPPPPMGRPPGPPRGENIPPQGSRRPHPKHQPTRSQEDAMRVHKHGGGSGSRDHSSPRRNDRRNDPRLPRRNSDSSLVSLETPLTDEEKKIRERRRDKERHHRERGERDSRSKPRPSRKLDIIDQLDATGIFGAGIFHHDGPFDALNPHRNRKGSSRAPMQAFPKDSLNNVLGGSGPLNERPDHSTFMGTQNQEAYEDYSSKDRISSSSRVSPLFDPLNRGGILHGAESMGLGTSTFLEGTPAARTVIQRREAEEQQNSVENGLQRKKSLAQRIRGMNRPRRDFEASGRMTNADGAYSSRRSPPANGAFTSSSVPSTKGERNPFFAEYNGKNDEEQISVRRKDQPLSPTSPGAPLERQSTAGDDEQNSKPGLLARVKSLKGGRRNKPSTSSVNDTASGDAPPGSAS